MVNHRGHLYSAHLSWGHSHCQRALRLARGAQCHMFSHWLVGERAYKEVTEMLMITGYLPIFTPVGMGTYNEFWGLTDGEPSLCFKESMLGRGCITKWSGSCQCGRSLIAREVMAEVLPNSNTWEEGHFLLRPRQSRQGEVKSTSEVPSRAETFLFTHISPKPA